jgi:Bacterial antitoxin of type II TA system, VapB
VRTSIDIDGALLAEAMAATGLKTKRKVVEAGLRLLARHRRRTDARKPGASDGRAICIENPWMNRTSPIGPHDACGFPGWARGLRHAGPAGRCTSPPPLRELCITSGSVIR